MNYIDETVRSIVHEYSIFHKYNYSLSLSYWCVSVHLQCILSLSKYHINLYSLSCLALLRIDKEVENKTHHPDLQINIRRYIVCYWGYDPRSIVWSQPITAYCWVFSESFIDDDNLLPLRFMVCLLFLTMFLMRRL